MAVRTELGNIQIFFGQVVDVDDPMQTYRCRVAIPGKTDQIEKEKLPWYYSFNGVGNLPNLNVEVPVFIFDGNFATGMYGSTMLSAPTQTEFTYKSYVELLKKDNASVTYNQQNGVEIENANNRITINKNSIKLGADKNNISLTKDTIRLGDENFEAALMGDQTVAYLKEILEYMNQTIKTLYSGFQTIMMSASGSPFTAQIGAALAPFIPTELQIRSMINFLDTKANNLQSKKIFHA